MILMHDSDMCYNYADAMEDYGFEPVHENRIENVLERIASQEEFHAVVMDMNYGSPGALTIDPAKKVYESMIAKGYDPKQMRLFAISAADDMESLEKDAPDGMQVVHKWEFQDYVLDEDSGLYK